MSLLRKGIRVQELRNTDITTTSDEEDVPVELGDAALLTRGYEGSGRENKRRVYG